MKHVLLVGAVGSGKSSMIERLMKELNRPVAGYITKKEDGLYEEPYGSPIYIYTTGEAHVQTEQNLLGYCKNHCFKTIEGAFNRHVSEILKPVSGDHLIVFDEIGFMESQESAFCEAILERLDGDIPVLAAVKDKDNPFLRRIKAHPQCVCFDLNEMDWNECFEKALTVFMKTEKTAQVRRPGCCIDME